MCYSVYLSTTSMEDLGHRPGDLFSFASIDKDDNPEIVGLLAYPARWRLVCRYGGCSCHFRHIEDESPTFSTPEAWRPEDADDIESTGAFYDFLRDLLGTGHRVDLIDVWSDARAEYIDLLSVSLGQVDRVAFRFFADWRFDLTM